MKRVENYNAKKYELINEYKGYGIYQQISCEGLKVVNSYLVVSNTNKIVIQSYNNISYSEILDAIDSKIDTGKFGFRVFDRDGIYVVHDCGNKAI